MSRIIEFRVYDKETEQYLPISNGTSDGVIGITANGQHIIYLEDGEINIDYANTYIIEQYIGIKDKNGKKIYEGDIVNICNGVVFLDSMRNKHDNSFGIGEVMWNWGGFWVRPFESGPCASLAEFIRGKEYCDYIEIIGNIHENEELSNDT